MYRVKSASGFNQQFPPVLLSRLALTVLKVYYAYLETSWLAIFLCLTGVVLWPLQMRTFVDLIKDRRVVFENIRSSAKQHFGKDPSCLKKKELDTLEENEELTTEQKLVLRHWGKHFRMHSTLNRYSLLTDSFSQPFWTVVLVLLVVNISIGVLQHRGVLTWKSRVPISSLLGADLNGDGMLSPTELARIGLSLGGKYATPARAEMLPWDVSMPPE